MECEHNPDKKNVTTLSLTPLPQIEVYQILPCECPTSEIGPYDQICGRKKDYHRQWLQAIETNQLIHFIKMCH